MQDYKILDVRKGTEWSNSFGTFQGYTLSLEGYGEPVMMNKKVPVENEPKKDDVLFGTVEVKHNKAGNEYSAFKSEKRPEGQVQTSSWTENPEKQDSIHRSVALNNAVLAAPYLKIGDDEKPSDVILLAAEEFYMWLKGETEKVDLNETVDKIFHGDDNE